MLLGLLAAAGPFRSIRSFSLFFRTFTCESDSKFSPESNGPGGGGGALPGGAISSEGGSSDPSVSTSLFWKLCCSSSKALPWKWQKQAEEAIRPAEPDSPVRWTHKGSAVSMFICTKGAIQLLLLRPFLLFAWHLRAKHILLLILSEYS